MFYISHPLHGRIHISINPTILVNRLGWLSGCNDVTEDATFDDDSTFVNFTESIWIDSWTFRVNGFYIICGRNFKLCVW